MYIQPSSSRLKVAVRIRPGVKNAIAPTKRYLSRRSMVLADRTIAAMNYLTLNAATSDIRTPAKRVVANGELVLHIPKNRVISRGRGNTGLQFIRRGVLNPKVCRGRVLSRRAIWSSSDCEKLDRSALFGRYCRSRSFVL